MSGSIGDFSKPIFEDACYRAVFEGASVGIARVAFEGERWLEVNDAFCSMLGYSLEEMLAQPWTAITHADDLELDLVPFRKMASGELEQYVVEKKIGRAHV